MPRHRSMRSNRRYHRLVMRSGKQPLDDKALTIEEWKAAGQPSMSEMLNTPKGNHRPKHR